MFSHCDNLTAPQKSLSIEKRQKQIKERIVLPMPEYGIESLKELRL